MPYDMLLRDFLLLDAELDLQDRLKPSSSDRVRPRAGLPFHRPDEENSLGYHHRPAVQR